MITPIACLASDNFICRLLQESKVPETNLDDLPFIDSPVEEVRAATPQSSDVPVAVETNVDASKTDDSCAEPDAKTQVRDEIFARKMNSPSLRSTGDHDSDVFPDDDVTVTPRRRRRTKQIAKERDFSPSATEVPRATPLDAIRGKVVVNGSKSREQLHSGDIFMRTAFRTDADREAALSNWGKPPQVPEKDRRRSDSDVSEIIPSPTTSSSRDSLEEKTHSHSDFIYTDSHPPAGTLSGVKKGSPNSSSYPILPRLDKTSRFKENGQKETHFPANFDLSDSSNSYTGK